MLGFFFLDCLYFYCLFGSHTKDLVSAVEQCHRATCVCSSWVRFCSFVFFFFFFASAAFNGTGSVNTRNSLVVKEMYTVLIVVPLLTSGLLDYLYSVENGLSVFFTLTDFGTSNQLRLCLLIAHAHPPPTPASFHWWSKPRYGGGVTA